MFRRVSQPETDRGAALLSWLEEAAPYGVVILDESLRVQGWNHWMEIHSGVLSNDAVGKTIFNLFPDLVERKLTGYLERALKGESSVLSASLHRYFLPLPSPIREVGLARMLQTARLAPLFSGDKICGVVLVIEDVSQRESQADQLERQHRRDELLSWTLGQFLKTGEPRKAVRQLFFKVAEQMDYDTFLVYLRHDETGELALEAVGGVPFETTKDLLTCPFTHLFGGNRTSFTILNSADFSKKSEYAVLQQMGIQAAFILPLLAKDRLLGFLCFATCVRAVIAKDESALLTTIGEYLATALDRDLTNQQLLHAKEKLREQALLLEERVEERTAQLKETISELEAFSYTVAHDLRAPIRAMTGYCDVLLEDFMGDLPPNSRSIVERISRASGRMDRLTRDLLEFTGISRQEITLTRVEIQPVIEELAALRVPSVRQAITFCTPLHPVLAHRGLLQQVFSNLIDNAIKFVEPNSSPKITITTEVVPHGSPNTRSRGLVFSSTEGMTKHADYPPQEPPTPYVRIWVSDEGIGIPQEAHQKIFGIFERATSAGLYDGTGIGLAIVARAMQRMGGACGVESEPGDGSRFWIELPAALKT